MHARDNQMRARFDAVGGARNPVRTDAATNNTRGLAPPMKVLWIDQEAVRDPAKLAAFIELLRSEATRTDSEDRARQDMHDQFSRAHARRSTK